MKKTEMKKVSFKVIKTEAKVPVVRQAISIHMHHLEFNKVLQYDSI
ncbi:hypothetical protein PT287_00295 [Lactobacillus sp. ESL0679]|nr:hypothetical protein [Lactobacillus sp. ESL0679]MDF7681960.1 hypothetical protein [Lactobacillus sp. ESL0679]